MSFDYIANVSGVDESRRGSDGNDTRAEDLEEEPPTWEGKRAAS